MAQLARTAAARPQATIRRLGFDAFRAAVASSFVPLEVTAAAPQEFRGSLRQVAVHGVTFTEVRASAHTVERTAELVRRTPRGCFKLSLQLEGDSTLRQDGRTAQLRPGDLAIYDTARPYVLGFPAPGRLMVVQLPHERLHLPAELVPEVTAVRLSGDRGVGGLASSFLTTLATNLGELRGPAAAQLAQTAVTLLDILLAAELDLASRRADPRHALRQRVRAHIEQHLADPELSPSSIAAAAFVSVRHLHSLFHEQGSTVAAHIRTRRLERCYHDLSDPVVAQLPIAAVGARWGFKDAAHFSRAFKAAYGELPSEVRRRAVHREAA